MKWLIFAVLLSVMQGGPPTLPTAVQNKVAPTSPQKGASSEGDDAKQNHIVVDKLPKKDRWDIFYIFLTLALVVIGAVTVGAILFQAVKTGDAVRATERSTNLVISKERAKLRLENSSLESRPKLSADWSRGFISYKISNYGITKAIVVSASFGATIDASPAANVHNDILLPGKLPTTVAPDTVLDCVVEMFHRFTGDVDLKAVANGKLFVRFFGHVKYRDVFDIERETSFYLLWKSFSPMSVAQSLDLGSWIKIGPPDANRET